ncbi:MFS transporter [Microbacterium gorillae]|uniref:MFS transporter n=1 Tax=Microbacterium gorillae TaxID=1231063 RepID=UPI00058EE168|nr:MFS transporter [Microbacterium gorillae]
MTTDTAPQTIPASDTTQTLSRARGLAALVAMAFTSFILITAEFLPGGLLIPIAAELGVTPGQAGQTVTVTAFAGLLVAPTIGTLLPRADRARVMVLLAVLAAASDLAVAFAPSITVLLLSRLLIGAAIGGFWALSLTVVARITSGRDVARGMMIVNIGNTLATVIGVPLGIWASGLLPWREVFVAAAVITAAVAVLLAIALPRVRPQRSEGLRGLVVVLRRSGVALALSGHVLVVLGHMAAYAFIRVALERVPGIEGPGTALMLTAFGVGGFVGNLVIGAIAERFLPVLRLAVPLGLGAALIVLGILPALPVAAIAVTAWGASFGGWLVVVNTWTAHRLPDRLEAGGGLVVVGFQLAITVGAAVGGVIVDSLGAGSLLVAAGAVTIIGGVIFAGARQRTPDLA